MTLRQCAFGLQAFFKKSRSWTLIKSIKYQGVKMQ